MVGQLVLSPRRGEKEAHHCVGYPVAQGGGVCGYRVEWEVLRVALVVVSEEGDDEEREEEVER